jgi:uncharacterized protein with PIN domain
MSKAKITSESQPCPKCAGKLIRRKHDQPAKAGQKYYFAWFFVCTKCGSLFMVEAAKRYVRQDLGECGCMGGQET